VVAAATLLTRTPTPRPAVPLIVLPECGRVSRTTHEQPSSSSALRLRSFYALTVASAGQRTTWARRQEASHQSPARYSLHAIRGRNHRAKGRQRTISHLDPSLKRCTTRLVASRLTFNREQAAPRLRYASLNNTMEHVVHEVLCILHPFHYIPPGTGPSRSLALGTHVEHKAAEIETVNSGTNTPILQSDRLKEYARMRKMTAQCRGSAEGASAEMTRNIVSEGLQDRDRQTARRW